MTLFTKYHVRAVVTVREPAGETVETIGARFRRLDPETALLIQGRGVGKNLIVDGLSLALVEIREEDS